MCCYLDNCKMSLISLDVKRLFKKRKKRKKKFYTTGLRLHFHVPLIAFATATFCKGPSSLDLVMCFCETDSVIDFTAYCSMLS